MSKQGCQQGGVCSKRVSVKKMKGEVLIKWEVGGSYGGVGNLLDWPSPMQTGNLSPNVAIVRTTVACRGSRGASQQLQGSGKCLEGFVCLLGR